MSHVVQTSDVSMKSLEVIKAACERLGWSFLEGKTEYEWFGHWVDDSPVPDAFDTPEVVAKIRAMSIADRKAYMTARIGKCDHAIAVPGAKYQVGLVRKPDGSWSLQWDWFGSGGLVGKMDAPEFQKAHKGGLFTQAYNVEAAKRVARLRGMAVREVQRADGKVELLVQAR